MGLLAVHGRGSDVGNDGCLAVASQSRLEDARQLGVTIRDVGAVGGKFEGWFFGKGRRVKVESQRRRK